MGEYATRKSDGEHVKIGTCEDMFYLRADQVGQIQRESGSLDPADPDTQTVIRFRFPWPSEDGTAPGDFEDPFRHVGLNLDVPDDVEHGTKQFSADGGYLVSLPCPESAEGKDLVRRNGLTMHHNGYSGATRIVQQAYRNGNLALVCECAGCGYKWSLPTLAEVQPVLDALDEAAEYHSRRWRITDPDGETIDPGAWWREIAQRIRAGYAVAAPVTA